jgi:hypothetical protein
MTPIAELIGKLERATGPDRELDALIAVTVAGFFEIAPRWEGEPIGYGYFDADGARIESGHGGDELVPDYTASLDAALALAEKLLPGWKLMMHLGGLWGEPIPGATFSEPDFAALSRKNLPYRRGQANAETLPIAICLALLRSLSSQKPGNGE